MAAATVVIATSVKRQRVAVSGRTAVFDAHCRGSAKGVFFAAAALDFFAKPGARKARFLAVPSAIGNVVLARPGHLATPRAPDQRRSRAQRPSDFDAPSRSELPKRGQRADCAG